MKKFLSGLCASALTVAVGLTGVMPANAAPVYVPSAVRAQQADVIQVQDGWRWKKRRGGWDGPRFGNRRDFRARSFRNWDGPRRIDRRAGWYNGHRGYRYKRYRSDRYHDGFWFPAGAFIAGAIVGGAIANSNTYYRGGGGSAHVEWCYDRYRSYRAYDNTFQPYNGPRRQCYSPYG